MKKTLQLHFDFNKEPNETPIPEQDKKAEKQFVFDMMDILTAPIITFPSSWSDSLPKQLLQDIKTARIMAALKKEEIATLPEVVAYMMPATYESPMRYEWANVYLWACAQYMETFRKKDVSELAPVELDSYEQQLLAQLRNWIYRKRREYMKKLVRSR